MDDGISGNDRVVSTRSRSKKNAYNRDWMRRRRMRDRQEAIARHLKGQAQLEEPCDG